MGIAAGAFTTAVLANGNVEPKWSQAPHPPQEGFNVPSDLDWQTLEKAGPGNPGPGPNWVVADDFRSDGRPITCVRWWGSYVDPAFEPDMCEPMPNGLGCAPTICPDPTEECVPVAVVFDPASGAIRVVDCDCRNPDECRVGVGPGGDPVCVGGCPPGQQCVEITTQLPDGTVEISCECVPNAPAVAPPGEPLVRGVPGFSPVAHSGFASRPTPTPIARELAPSANDGAPGIGIFGACCFPDGGCMVLQDIECAAVGGGTFFPGQPCSPDLCLPGTGTEIDGWLVSFHTDLPADQAPFGYSQPRDLLGLYFCPASAVDVIPTNIVGWDGHRVFEYVVELRDCILIHRAPDPRPGAMPVVPARPGRFCETEGFIYWLDVQAVVGHTFKMTPDGPVEVPTPNRAFEHFWGWHTSPDAFNDVSTMNMVVMGPNGEWVYPPMGWEMVDGQAHGLDIVDQAFELLTPTCPWDFDGNSNVGFSDLTELLANWGPCPADSYCPWDFDCSGAVGFADLTELLANWGPC